MRRGSDPPGPQGVAIRTPEEWPPSTCSYVATGFQPTITPRCSRDSGPPTTPSTPSNRYGPPEFRMPGALPNHGADPTATPRSDRLRRAISSLYPGRGRGSSAASPDHDRPPLDGRFLPVPKRPTPPFAHGEHALEALCETSRRPASTTVQTGLRRARTVRLVDNDWRIDQHRWPRRPSPLPVRNRQGAHGRPLDRRVGSPRQRTTL